jgi:hypothetical protein
MLLLLGRHKPDQTTIDQAKSLAEDKFKGASETVSLAIASFEELIAALDLVRDERDIEMARVLEDFVAFASSEGLLPLDEYTLRVVGCSRTIPENVRLRIYYDSAGYRPHRYIGLYANKAVQYIGKVSKVADIDLEESTGKIILTDDVTLTRDEEERFRQAVATAKDHGWNIAQGTTFWFAESFESTDFQKSSTGPLLGKRYFDLRYILEAQKLAEISEIANRLRGRTWQ